LPISACAYSSKTLRRLLSREPGLALDSARWAISLRVDSPDYARGAHMLNRVWIRLKIPTNSLIRHDLALIFADVASFATICTRDSHRRTQLRPCEAFHHSVTGDEMLTSISCQAKRPHQIHTGRLRVSLQVKRPTIVPLVPPNGGANGL
jgi:hypothetical protein